MKQGYSGDVWIADRKGYYISSGYHWLSVDHEAIYGVVGSGTGFKYQNKGLCGKGSTKLKVISDALCPLCMQEEETVDHLFFECSFAQALHAKIQLILKLNINIDNLAACNASLSSVQGRFRKINAQSCYAGLIYSIWRQRRLSGR